MVLLLQFGIDNLAMLLHRERCYNFANIKPWAAQLAQGRCKWHHLRLETRRHPVSRRRAPATPAKNSAPKGYRHPGYPQRSFRWNQWGLVLQRYEGVMKWRPVQWTETNHAHHFHHAFSFFYHLESLFLSHVASKDSAQTFASGPENIDERRKGHCGNSSFQQWPFRQRFPERFALVWWLLISVDCWCHGFVAATLKWEDLFYYIYTCIYYARGWWTSVYHFFSAH